MGSLSSLLLALLAACAPHPAPPAHTVPVGPGVSLPFSGPEVLAPLADGTLPRPFTAAELHAGLPDGSRIHLVVAMPGQPVVEQRWTFLDGTATAVTIASEMWAGGALVKDEGKAQSEWTALVEHAAFPAAAAARYSGRVPTKLGTLDAWLYEVTEAGDDGAPVLARYWFAKSLPGPPVLYTQERDGVEIFRMEQILHDRGPS